MAQTNRDGAGLSYVEFDERCKDRKHIKDCNCDVVAEHTMGGPKEVAEMYERHIDKSLMIHCRIATHGEKNLENCHPYKLTDKKEGHKRTIYACHNGMIPGVQIDDKMSDSWNFFNYILKPALIE